MKKLLALLLTLVFVLALSACDNKGDGSVTNRNDKTTTATEQKDNTNEPSQNRPENSQPQDTQSQNQPTVSQTTPPQSNLNTITRDRAIELALNHAKLTIADVHDLEAELDRERGEVYWEVDFESGNLEYSYDINAETEEIIKLEKERD